MLRTVFITLFLSFATLATAVADTPLTYDRINLSVSAGSDVENDTLVAVMYAQQEGSDSAQLAKEVNATVKQAVEQAKRKQDIKVQTLEYTTNPVYRKQSLRGWRVRQSIRLESKNSGVLSELIGDLQVRLGVSSISYTISPDNRTEAESSLISEAIARFKQRAQLISKDMGSGGYRLVQMNINTSGRVPSPRYMRSAAMEMKSDSSPTLEAGTQRVEVSINGTIELQP